MPQKGNHNFDELFLGLTDQQSAFLRSFLDVGNPRTFMRAGPSAKAAGLSEGYGSLLKKTLSPRIRTFLEECGLDVVSLQAKLLELMNARETKILTLKGKVEEWQLLPGQQIIAISEHDRETRSGDTVTEYTTVLAVDTEAPGLQLRALDMAVKIEGMYAPDRHEHSGPDGGPIDIAELSDTERAARIESLLERARTRRAGSAGDGGSA